MGIYNVAEYGVDKYGEAPKLAFSVAPFISSAIDYSSVELSWTQPAGEYTGLRLVRSQDGYPETEEDGVILWEWYEGSGEPRITSFVDAPSEVPSPLTSGRFAYYTIWALRTSGLWISTGSTFTVVPASHAALSPDGKTLISTQDKLMDYLPRVYTTATQSPLDVVDQSTELYRFLSAMSFTLDEMLTLADNLLPDESGRFSNPQLIDLGAKELGFVDDPYLSTKNKKRLVREGIDIFSKKGVSNSIASYAESLTGFAPTITTSPNLMLGLADSTFYKGTGFWYATGGCTLSLETTVPTITTSTEPNSIDTQYTARVDIAQAGAGVRNGDFNPITRGIPVQFGTTYTFSYYVKTDSGTVSVTPNISWFDFQGNLLPVTSSTGPTDATTSWEQHTFTAKAPGEIYTVTSYEVVDDEVTLTLSTSHSFVTASEIQVVGVDDAVNGTHQVLSFGLNTVTYVIGPNDPPLNVTATSVSEGTLAPKEEPAVYASVALTFGDTGTVYLDAVQFAESSVTAYDEARAIEVFLAPSKTNYLNNPSFDDGNQSEWTVDAASATYEATTLTTVLGGNDMLTIVANPGAETSISAETGTITTGKYYTFSIYAKMAGLSITAATVSSGVATLTLSGSPAWQVGDEILVSNLSVTLDGTQTITAISGNQVSYATTAPDQTVTVAADSKACRPETMNLKLEAFNEVTSEVTDSKVSSDFSFTDEWARYSVTLFVTFTVSATHLIATVVGDTAGCAISFDAAQVEEAYLPTDYFDGEYPTLFGAVWEGTAHDSPSHVYPNKNTKLVRLKDSLKEYLPINTAYRIRTYAGVEYSVLP